MMSSEYLCFFVKSCGKMMYCVIRKGTAADAFDNFFRFSNVALIYG